MKMKSIFYLSLFFMLFYCISCHNITEGENEDDISPLWYVDPTALDFGSYGINKIFFVKNIGGGTLIWTFKHPYLDGDDSQNPLSWVSLSHISNSLAAGKQLEVTVSIDRRSIQQPGSYHLIINPESEGFNGGIPDPMHYSVDCYVTQP